MKNKLYTLKAESKVPFSRKIFNGVSHMVLPITILVEGVHHAGNADVPYYYPEESISFFPQAWNDTATLINHPEGLTANTIAIHEKDVLGRLWNMKYEDGLKGEAWIDEAKLKAKNPDLHSRIESGEAIEVSTGVYLELNEEEGEWNGEKYGAKVLHIWPDHLALLPDGKGACSIDDGCGIRNQSKDTAVNVMSKARKPDYAGIETTRWYDMDTRFTAFRNGFYVHTRTPLPETIPCCMDEAPPEMKEWIASKTLLGNPEAKTEDGIIAFPVVNPETNMLNQNALLRAISDDSSDYGWLNLPAEVRSSAANMALSLLTMEFGAELSVMNKSNESFLNKAIEKLKTLIGKKEDCQCKKTEVLKMDREKVVSALITNGTYKPEDKEELMKLDEKHLAVIAKLSETPPPAEETNGKEDEGEEAPKAETKTGDEPKTVEEYIGGLPPDVQEVVQESLNMRKQKKEALIKGIMANKSCKFTKDELAGKSVQELEKLAELAKVSVDYSLQAGGATENEGKMPMPPPLLVKNGKYAEQDNKQ